MCEYCGCQALRVIADLTGEHDLVVNLIGDVRAAADGGDIVAVAGLARQIGAVLGPHTAVEERGLFPALATDFGDQVAVLEAEHRHIETVLGEAATGIPTDPAWPARLLAALHLLREHILKEQDGVFPAALTTLRTGEWELIEEIRSQVGVHLPYPAR
jgi:hemerythrin-like domain-containing protein